MIELPITGWGDEGYIHLPSGPLPIRVTFDDDGTPILSVDTDTAPPERIAEITALIFGAEEGPHVLD